MSFWIMPDLEQAKANQLWLSQEMGYCVKDSRIYVAPVYNKLGPIKDESLIRKIKEASPAFIFIQLGGGVQERLGLFLKNNLHYRPTILCTGAAIAFLSGEQAAIPEWADRFYLGWLFRCIFSPKVFIPRYVKAFKLLNLLRKHGHQFPA
jgi:UDP-N-acetyl-D-mannosaminuronic acid transferase (WecB/TagA/CpsF family)